MWSCTTHYATYTRSVQITSSVNGMQTDRGNSLYYTQVQSTPSKMKFYVPTYPICRLLWRLEQRWRTTDSKWHQCNFCNVTQNPKNYDFVNVNDDHVMLSIEPSGQLGPRFGLIPFTSVSARWQLYIDGRSQIRSTPTNGHRFTTLGLPRRSSIQVLTEVHVAWLQWTCHWASLGHH